MSSEKRRYELRARAERQLETRRRIVDATVALHEEVGPANTTVAEIARRAGVQRLTVYNHFPDEAELFAACQRQFLAEHPLPDLSAALALADPRRRITAALEALYRSFREREPMTAKVLRDRALVPALDALMTQTMDAQLEQLTRALSAGFRVRGQRRRRLETIIDLALDFSTWQRMNSAGLSDPQAAALMGDVVMCIAAPGRAAP
jgi:AcrR family transcriptional regulator